jgi:hypothetical protein
MQTRPGQMTFPARPRGRRCERREFWEDLAVNARALVKRRLIHLLQPCPKRKTKPRKADRREKAAGEVTLEPGLPCLSVTLSKTRYEWQGHKTGE